MTKKKSHFNFKPRKEPYPVGTLFVRRKKDYGTTEVSDCAMLIVLDYSHGFRLDDWHDAAHVYEVYSPDQKITTDFWHWFKRDDGLWKVQEP